MNTDEEIVEKFYLLQTREDVSELLGIKDSSLRYFLYGVRPDNMYTTFTIPKKSGGVRKISSPDKRLKQIQRKLLYILKLVYNPKPAVYGFVDNKNISENAENHIGRKWILNIDLENFFSQFHFGRVRGMFMAKPYSVGDEAALVLAQLVCYKGVLPQGAPTSPIITNMICAPFDNRMVSFAQKNRLIYTRYADDITISSYKKHISDKVIKEYKENLVLSKDLLKIFEKHNLQINYEKVKLELMSNRQEVTGLIVNEKINVRREYIKNLRAILHNTLFSSVYEAASVYIEKGLCKNSAVQVNYKKESYKEFVEKWFKSVLIGKLSYIQQIRGNEDKTFLKLAEVFNYAFGEEYFDTSFLEDANIKIERNVYIIESDEDIGTGFYIKEHGLVTCAHVISDVDDFILKDSNGKKLIYFNKNEYLMSEDAEIDYAFLNIKRQNGFLYNEKAFIEIGMEVIIAGFPNYLEGNTINIQHGHVTSQVKYFKNKIWTVDVSLAKGLSGGVVLNSELEVIGIVVSGKKYMDSDETDTPHGFMPFKLVMQHLLSKIKTE